MPARRIRYIPFLFLISTWASKAGVPPELVVRRLGDWALADGFRPGAFVTRSGEIFDPLELLVWCRACAAGPTVTIGDCIYNVGDGERFLEDVFVTLEDVIAFCHRTNTLPPFQGLWWLLLRVLGRVAGLKHSYPPACTEADVHALRSNARKIAEAALDDFRELLAYAEADCCPVADRQLHRLENGAVDWEPGWRQARQRAQIAIDLSEATDLQSLLTAMTAKLAPIAEERAARVAAMRTARHINRAGIMSIEHGPRRLCIKRREQVAVIDGKEKRIPAQSFKLLCYLAEKAQCSDCFIPTRELENFIWGKQLHKISRPVRDVVRELRNVLADGDADGKAVRSLIEAEPGRGGFRLVLPAHEIEIKP